MIRNKLAICVLIIGVLLVIIDAAVYGEYTGFPNTDYGWIGCISMFIMTVTLVFKSYS